MAGWRTPGAAASGSFSISRWTIRWSTSPGREFVGYHLLAESELSTQVIAKRDPLERVGNVVEVDGRLHVIEYSDLPDEIARRRNSDGSLAIWAGSIAVHVFDVAFLDGWPTAPTPCRSMSRERRSPTSTPRGNARPAGRAQRDQVRAVHLRPVALGRPGDRGRGRSRRAFAPLKNAPGEKADTPETVRAQMVAEHAGWLRRAGVEVADGVAVEISPLLALDADELAEKITPGLTGDRADLFC